MRMIMSVSGVGMLVLSFALAGLSRVTFVRNTSQSSISLKGKITKEAVMELKEKYNNNVLKLIINSPGGFVDPSLEAGYFIYYK